MKEINRPVWDLCRVWGSRVRWSGVDQTSGRGPKIYDAAGGTDPGGVRDGCLMMTDGLAVIGDFDIRLKSGMGLVSSNGSIPGLSIHPFIRS